MVKPLWYFINLVERRLKHLEFQAELNQLFNKKFLKTIEVTHTEDTFQFWIPSFAFSKFNFFNMQAENKFFVSFDSSSSKQTISINLSLF